ncbi:hypothetical protein [uncultured Treponema sp.]|uniref:hypothetical protein n=1 Tax=uncultured Treponema sp. TaxID=162155 RepID=UPI0025EF7998|nr:hypothetical protein [uncultured Treponema sp.]
MTDIKEQYCVYLSKKKNYADSTARSYKSFVKRIAEREQLSDLQFVESINEIIHKYDTGGVEEDFGNQGKRTAINALYRFKEFMEDEHIGSQIEVAAKKYFADNNIVYQTKKQTPQIPEEVYAQKRKQMMEKREYFASISAHYWAYVTLCFTSFFTVFGIAGNIPEILKNVLAVVILILGIAFALVWISLNASYNKNMKQLSLELQLLEVKLNSPQKNLEQTEIHAQQWTVAGAVVFLTLFVILLFYMLVSIGIQFMR